MFKKMLLVTLLCIGIQIRCFASQENRPVAALLSYKLGIISQETSIQEVLHWGINKPIDKEENAFLHCTIEAKWHDISILLITLGASLDCKNNSLVTPRRLLELISLSPLP